MHASTAASDSDDQSGGNVAEDEDGEGEDKQEEVDEKSQSKGDDTNQESQDGTTTDGKRDTEVPGAGLFAQELADIAPAEAEPAVATTADPHEAEQLVEQPVPVPEPFSRAAEQRLRMELDGLAAQIRDHSIAYWSTHHMCTHLKRRRNNQRFMARKLALKNQDVCKAGLKGLEVALAEDRSASTKIPSLASRRRLKSVSVLIDRQIDQQVEGIIDLQPSSTRSSATGSATTPTSPISLLSTPRSPRTKGCRAAQLAAAQIFRGPFAGSRRDSAVRNSIELPEDLGERNFAFGH